MRYWVGKCRWFFGDKETVDRFLVAGETWEDVMHRVFLDYGSDLYEISLREVSDGLGETLNLDGDINDLQDFFGSVAPAAKASFLEENN